MGKNDGRSLSLDELLGDYGDILSKFSFVNDKSDKIFKSRDAQFMMKCLLLINSVVYIIYSLLLIIIDTLLIPIGVFTI